MAAGRLALAGFAVSLVLPFGLVPVAAGAAESCLPAGSSGPVADLDPEQSANARVILTVGEQRGVPPPGPTVALMAAMQESGLRNLPFGDRDSLGLFQQRPSAGWGKPAQLLEPAYAAAAFFGGSSSPASNPGLLDIPGWQVLPLAAAAQAVQRSAFPGAYARWQAAAQAVVDELVSGPTVAAAPCQPMGAGAATVVGAAARWIGTPYSWGGGDARGPTVGIGSGAHTVGFDCSGLTLYAYAQAGITLPHSSRAQWGVPGRRIDSMAELQPGDLVFFATNPAAADTIHHVALSVGGDAMLEAPDVGQSVQLSEHVSGNAYWAPQFIGGLRLLR